MLSLAVAGDSFPQDEGGEGTENGSLRQSRQMRQIYRIYLLWAAHHLPKSHLRHVLLVVRIE